VLHVLIAGLIGGVCVLKFNTAEAARQPQRLLRVDFVKAPEDALKPPKVEQPKPARMPEMVHRKSHDRMPVHVPNPRSTVPMPRLVRPTTPSVRGASPPGNPGGRLNVGSLSKGGDLGGGWSGGKTPVGWVPGDDRARGAGSGSGNGVGNPEPPKHADDGPGTRPAPARAPDPPAPRMVTVRLCSESGMVAGEHCRRTRVDSFVDGRQPERRCNQCKAPEPEHKSRLADQAKPVLVRDPRVSVPGSVDEGLSLSVTVEFTVTADGDVSGVDITRSSGNKAVDRAVASAASGRKYKPAVQDGSPRAVKVSVTYRINT